MTAALAAAKVNVDRPHIEVSGVQSMRNSVEIKNSCNCFQACFPCFGKKVKPSHQEQHSKAHEVARSYLHVSIDDLERSRNIPHDSGRSSTSSLPDREISKPDQLEIAKRASAEYNDPVIDVHVTIMGSHHDLEAIKQLRAGDT